MPNYYDDVDPDDGEIIPYNGNIIPYDNQAIVPIYDDYIVNGECKDIPYYAENDQDLHTDYWNGIMMGTMIEEEQIAQQDPNYDYRPSHMYDPNQDDEYQRPVRTEQKSSLLGSLLNAVGSVGRAVFRPNPMEQTYNARMQAQQDRARITGNTSRPLLSRQPDNYFVFDRSKKPSEKNSR